MSRGYGRGSIVSFIVVGIVLTALVLGGLYAVTTGLDGRLGGQSTEEAVEEVAQVADEATEDDTNQPDEATTEDEQTPTEESTDTQDQAPESQTQSDDEESATATTDEDANDTAQENSPSETTEEDDTMPITGVELPQTGIGDALLGALPLVALVAAVVAYRRSNVL